jgi:hypothetical protein
MTAPHARANWLTRTIGIIALLGALITFSLPAAAAGDSIRLTIRPADGDLTSYFKITVEPGQTVRLAAQLGNAGESRTNATTFAADAYTMPNGGFGVRDISAEQSGPTTWVSYPTETFEIEPGASTIREFDVTVPLDTEPGDYLTSLVIQNTDAIDATGAVALDQIVRQFVAIAIDVPGERAPALSIDTVSHDVTAGRSVVAFDVTNTGNRHLQPTGAFLLLDAQDNVIAQRDVAMNQFYAMTGTTFSVALDTLLAPGDYYASLTLTDPGTTSTATFEEAIFSVPVVEVPEAVNDDGSIAAPATTNAPMTVSNGPSTTLMLAIGAGCLIAGVAITVLVMRVRSSRNRLQPASITNETR